MSHFDEKMRLPNRMAMGAATPSPLQRSHSKHYTPTKLSNKSENRFKRYQHMTPDTGTPYRHTHSPNIDKFNQSIQRLEKEVKRLNQKKDEQSQDSYRLRKMVMQKDRQSKTSDERYEHQLRRSRRIESELVEALTKLKLLEVDNLGLKNTLTINDQRWQDQYNSLQREFDRVNRNYSNLLSGMSKPNRSHDYQIDSLQKQISRVRDAKNRDKLGQCHRCSELTRELQMANLNEELRKIEGYNLRQEKNLKVVKGAYNERHFKSIEDHPVVDYLANDTHINKYRNDDKSEQIRNLKEQIDKLSLDNKKLQFENESLKRQVTQRTTQLHEHQLKVKAPPVPLKHDVPSEVTILKKQVEQLSKDLKNAAKKNELLTEQKRRVDTQSSNLKKEIKLRDDREQYTRKRMIDHDKQQGNRKEESDKLKASTDAELDRLRKSQAALIKNVDELKSQLSELTIIKEHLAKEKEDNKKLAKTLQDNNKNHQTALQEYKASLKAAENSRRDAETQAKKNQDILRKEIKSIEETNRKHEEMRRLDEERRRLEEEKRIQQKSSKVEPVTEPFVEPIAEPLNEPNLQIEALRQNILDLQSQIEDLTTVYQKSINQNYGLMEKLKVAEDHNVKLQQEMETLKSSILNASQQITRLNQDALRQDKQLTIEKNQRQKVEDRSINLQIDKAMLEEELSKFAEQKQFNQNQIQELKTQLKQIILNTQNQVSKIFEDLQNGHLKSIFTQLQQLEKKISKTKELASQIVAQPNEIAEGLKRQISKLIEKNVQEASVQGELQQQLERTHKQLQIRIEESKQSTFTVQDLRKGLLEIAQNNDTNLQLVKKLVEIQERLKQLESKLT